MYKRQKGNDHTIKLFKSAGNLDGFSPRKSVLFCFWALGLTIKLHLSARVRANLKCWRGPSWFTETTGIAVMNKSVTFFLAGQFGSCIIIAHKTKSGSASQSTNKDGEENNDLRDLLEFYLFN